MIKISKEKKIFKLELMEMNFAWNKNLKRFVNNIIIISTPVDGTSPYRNISIKSFNLFIG